MEMEKTIEKIPTWSLCYLINDDPSGLTDEEIQAVDCWCDNLGVQIVSPTQDADGNMQPYFSQYPAFGLPAEVEDCDILYTHVEPDKI